MSDDGLLWREEDGWRLAVSSGLMRLEPYSVLAVEGGWQLYYNGFDGRTWAIYRARSKDGLQWQPEGKCQGLVVGKAGTKGGSVVETEGEKQLFFIRKDPDGEGLYTAQSMDGMHWHDVRRCSGYAIEGDALLTSPRVIATLDGEWRMFFSEWVDKSFVGMRIAGARSSDGIYWQREPRIVLEPGGRYDPHGVFCPQIVDSDTGQRMYYGGFWQRH